MQVHEQPGAGCYHAYGIQFQADLNLDEYLVPGSKPGHELTVLESRQGASRINPGQVLDIRNRHGRDLRLVTDREFQPSTVGQDWCLEVAELAQFWWRGGEAEIHYSRQPGAGDGLLAFWLIHIFLPLHFTLEDRYEFIHASAVEVDGRTILFTAPTHGGKSTLTDFFLRQGHTLVSDDKVATCENKGNYIAAPSHPNHRPYRKFEDLGYRVDRFDPGLRPIDAIYTLQRGEPEDDVLIREVTGHRKFAGLRPSYLFDFNSLKEKRLQYLAGLLNAVPVYDVQVPWEIERLTAVYEAIVSHGDSIRRRR